MKKSINKLKNALNDLDSISPQSIHLLLEVVDELPSNTSEEENEAYLKKARKVILNSSKFILKNKCEIIYIGSPLFITLIASSLYQIKKLTGATTIISLICLLFKFDVETDIHRMRNGPNRNLRLLHNKVVENLSFSESNRFLISLCAFFNLTLICGLGLALLKLIIMNGIEFFTGLFTTS